MTVRVVIAEDEALMREALRTFLDADESISVVAEAGSGLDAVDAARRARADVVLMDIQMPGVDGIEATHRLLSAAPPHPRVLILTTFGHDRHVYEALRAGASGFLLKTTPPAELRAAIRAVAAGDALLSPDVTRRLIEAHVSRPAPSERPPALADLTDRERDVVRLIAAGRSNAEIAAELYLAEGTVKTHVTRILRKLDARDRAQVVMAAYESGFVTPGATAAPPGPP